MAPRRRPSRRGSGTVARRPAAKILVMKRPAQAMCSSMIVQALENVEKTTSLAPIVKESSARTEALSQTRLTKFGGKYEPLAASSGNRSLLEKIQTLESVEKNYQEMVRLFAGWQKEEGLPDPNDPYELCCQFLDLLDVMFMGGSDHSDATKMWAALVAHVPRLVDSPAGMRRVQKSLNAWWKRSPGGSGREVWPEEIAYAIAGVLLHRKLVLQAVGVILEMDSYQRPGEIDALTVKQMVAPQRGRSSCWVILTHPSEDQIPGKTGIVDGSILLDGVNQEMWNAILPALVGQRNPDELLLPIPPSGKSSLSQVFKEALETLKLDNLQIVRYGLRHTGASRDLAQQYRQIQELKDRGGWRSDASMARYAKVARMLKTSQKIPDNVQRYGELVRARFLDLMMGKCKVPEFKTM